MYKLGAEGRKELGLKAMRYAHTEYDMDNLIKTWDEGLEDVLANWRSRRSVWTKKVVR